MTYKFSSGRLVSVILTTHLRRCVCDDFNAPSTLCVSEGNCVIKSSFLHAIATKSEKLKWRRIGGGVTHVISVNDFKIQGASKKFPE